MPLRKFLTSPQNAVEKSYLDASSHNIASLSLLDKIYFGFISLELPARYGPANIFVAIYAPISIFIEDTLLDYIRPTLPYDIYIINI